jgi:asparagine synthase (glutamine-hydrolysing)
MCGIAGIFGANDTEAVSSMLRAMAHRGPDDEGLYADPAVTLGHRRLAIIDVSPAGHQPMSTADGAIQIVFNGEIYNYREKRAALEARGHRFHSQSDTEVLLALYERYGEDFLSHLRGIFALALYDRRAGAGREKLLLARDNFGIKPLLYAERNGRLVFASELKGLLASGLVSREPDPEAVRMLLSLGSIQQPRTFIREAKALPSGHYLTVERGRTRLQRYWGYATDRIAGLRKRRYEEQVDALREVLVDTVRLQMVADVPVGAFLSGGVDSSLIAALMARETNGRVLTFSVGFDYGANTQDESRDAAETAVLLDTDHTRVHVGNSEVAEHLKGFIRGLDQPSVDGLNSYFVSYAAAQRATVALSGTGGDELFLGYPWFAHIEHQFGSDPLDDAGRRGWRQLWRLTPPSTTADGDAGAKFRNGYGGLYHCFGPDFADRLLNPALRAETGWCGFDQDLDPADEIRQAGALDRASVLCLNSYTRNQLLRDIDACSMAHSLEVRVPFLDREVADFALSLPHEAKLRVGEQTLAPGASYDESGVKRIVCDVARSYLPAEFFAKRSKTGFILPVDDWLRGPLADILADALSPASVAAAGWFDPVTVSEISAGFLRRERHWSHPWVLMIAELWRRDVLAR